MSSLNVGPIHNFRLDNSELYPCEKGEKRKLENLNFEITDVKNNEVTLEINGSPVHEKIDVTIFGHNSIRSNNPATLKTGERLVISSHQKFSENGHFNLAYKNLAEITLMSNFSSLYLKVKKLS